MELTDNELNLILLALIGFRIRHLDDPEMIEGIYDIQERVKHEYVSRIFWRPEVS